MLISLFASSLVSAYWNGAATYYRGLLKALHARGHQIHFYESDAFNRQHHRDIDDPSYARVTIYSHTSTDNLNRCLDESRSSDLIIKASGNGVFDQYLEEAVLSLKTPTNLIAFLDVDAPATLDRIRSSPPHPTSDSSHPTSSPDPFLPLIPQYDLILTYGGGQGVIDAYAELGARSCTPIYNALDPETHHPVPPQLRFRFDLALLANRMPDREARIHDFFLSPAESLPDRRFLLGGNGWPGSPLPHNVLPIGHVYTQDHNAINCSAMAVLNVHRDSMARYGFSPATRVFEAAGAAACLISDAAPGLEAFFDPGTELLLADDGQDVVDHLTSLTPRKSHEIGQAALKRALAHHTYAHRAAQLDELLDAIPRNGSPQPLTPSLAL